VVSGRGFLLTQGIELKFSKSGLAYARLPLGFKNARRGQDGVWTHSKEIVIEGTVFGALAEALAETVTSQQEIHFVGELYQEEHAGKKYTKAVIHSAWPTKGVASSPVGAAAGRAPSTNGDLPF